MNKVPFLVLVGREFVTIVILEDELEVRCRTCLDKIDRDFYKTM